ncbi:hypothetical protein G6F57_023583 [Rhizopus arrhizus]|nr:hypothetical protein G6F57_023583 [Rhizopus arrhizus]
MRNSVSSETASLSLWPKRAGTAPSSVLHSRIWSYQAKSPTGTNFRPAAACSFQCLARSSRPVSSSASAVCLPAQ